VSAACAYTDYLTGDATMTLDDFNALSDQEAHDRLALCCVSERWIAPVVAGRPYRDRDTLLAVGDAVWGQMTAAEVLPAMEPYLLEAFAAHPRIGDLDSLREGHAESADLAAGEQSGVAAADAATLERLSAGNRAYEDRFGFTFIVCAAGKSASAMCELLEERLGNDRATELATAAAEQGKILRLRLEQLL